METVLGVVLLTILILACGLVGQQLHINRKNKRRREMRVANRGWRSPTGATGETGWISPSGTTVPDSWIWDGEKCQWIP